MSRLDKKVQKLNQMISVLDKEMKSIKIKEKTALESQSARLGSHLTDQGSSNSNLEMYNYEFRYLNDNITPQNRKTTKGIS